MCDLVARTGWHQQRYVADYHLVARSLPLPHILFCYLSLVFFHIFFSMYPCMNDLIGYIFLVNIIIFLKKMSIFAIDYQFLTLVGYCYYHGCNMMISIIVTFICWFFFSKPTLYMIQISWLIDCLRLIIYIQHDDLYHCYFRLLNFLFKDNIIYDKNWLIDWLIDYLHSIVLLLLLYIFFLNKYCYLLILYHAFKVKCWIWVNYVRS